MICIKCEKQFRRVPPHLRKRGVVIQSRAKLCPECRKKVIIERVERQRLRNLYLLKGGKDKMVTKKKVVKKIGVKPKTNAKGKRAPTKWQLHLSKTYKEMKKKNPGAKFSQAMVAAKKTYKK